MSHDVSEASVHFAVMVRAWCRLMDDRLVWRISVENVHTGELARFSDLIALCKYLERYGRALIGREGPSVQG